MSRLMPTLSALVLLSVASQLATAANVTKVVNHGQDGDATYYSVHCSNGSVGSVDVRHGARQICAASANGKEQCGTGWKVRAAAKLACR